MKKNLLTIITFALVLVNIVLTAILTITIMPEVKKVNELITTICDAIDLDLQAATGAESTESVSLENIDVYAVADQIMVNLKQGADGKSYVMVITMSLNINKNNANYETYGTNMDTYAELIKSTVTKVVSKHTVEECKADQEALQREIKNELNAQFGNGFIVSVGFSQVLYSEQ
ncbi:MAG: flagellar basal body-associated FliL family protein [Lachnospiraceae bacterium]|nr:flagellar basal body-associated FliL family protein [Lachnospiraceae bacterium]